MEALLLRLPWGFAPLPPLSQSVRRGKQNFWTLFPFLKVVRSPFNLSYDGGGGLIVPQFFSSIFLPKCYIVILCYSIICYYVLCYIYVTLCYIKGKQEQTVQRSEVVNKIGKGRARHTYKSINKQTKRLKVIRKFFIKHNKSFRWHFGDYEKHIFFHLKACERNFDFCVCFTGG